MRRKHTFALILGILFFSGSIFAQNNLVKLSGNYQGFADQIIGGTYLGFGAGFEAGMGDHFSVGIDAQYYRKSNDITGSDANEIRNLFNIQPEVRWYPKELYRGFYFGAHSTINLFDYKIKIDGDSSENPVPPGPDSAIGLGFTLGFIAPISENVTFGISAGGDVVFATSDNGAKFLIGTQFGYRL